MMSWLARACVRHAPVVFVVAMLGCREGQTIPVDAGPVDHTTTDAIDGVDSASGGDAQDVRSTDGVPDLSSDTSVRPDAGQGTTERDGPTNGSEPIGRAVGCRAPGTIWMGREALIEAFATAEGIIVVHAGGISLLDRSGRQAATVVAPRPIVTAAFDGAVLAVADATTITAYGSDLEPKGSITLVQPCASSVMLSDHRFVCRGSMGTGVFHTYDMGTLMHVASSTPYADSGIAMRRIPLREHVVTASTNTIPSDYHLYIVPPAAPVKSFGESPYHGDFVISAAYAFAGRPGTHVITPEGLLIEIFNPRCTPESSSSHVACFSKDGALGTLWSGEYFAALANDDQADIVYGVVSSAPPSEVGRPLCANGCKVQRIDPVQRLVVGQRTYQLPTSQIGFARHDHVCQMLLVGYPSAADAGAGYVLDLLEHGG